MYVNIVYLSYEKRCLKLGWRICSFMGHELSPFFPSCLFSALLNVLNCWFSCKLCLPYVVPSLVLYQVLLMI